MEPIASEKREGAHEEPPKDTSMHAGRGGEGENKGASDSVRRKGEEARSKQVNVEKR